MRNDAISAEVLAHYDRAFLMLRDLLDGFGDDAWTAGEEERLVPARWAYHSVSGTDFYIRESPDEFDHGAVVDWEGPVDMLPSRTELATYATDVQNRLHRTWKGRRDEEMLSPTSYTWTGATKLGQLLYNLRHLMYHLGEVSMKLRQQGAPASPWR